MAIYIEGRCDHRYGQLTDIETGKVYENVWQVWIELHSYAPLYETCQFCGYRRKMNKPKGLVL